MEKKGTKTSLSVLLESILPLFWPADRVSAYGRAFFDMRPTKTLHSRRESLWWTLSCFVVCVHVLLDGVACQEVDPNALSGVTVGNTFSECVDPTVDDMLNTCQNCTARSMGKSARSFSSSRIQTSPLPSSNGMLRC